MRTAFFWVITQRVAVICYRRFGTTCRSHLQGWKVLFWGNSLPLKIRPIGCPKTSVIIYHYSVRNDPEESSSRVAGIFLLGGLKTAGVLGWQTCPIHLRFAIETGTFATCLAIALSLLIHIFHITHNSVMALKFVNFYVLCVCLTLQAKYVRRFFFLTACTSCFH